jgi:hypothetical protein
MYKHLIWLKSVVQYATCPKTSNKTWLEVVSRW